MQKEVGEIPTQQSVSASKIETMKRTLHHKKKKRNQTTGVCLFFSILLKTVELSINSAWLDVWQSAMKLLTVIEENVCAPL